MKRNLSHRLASGLSIGTLLFALLLSGCQCKHEWTEATCEEAKTCSVCGETEGDPLGHTWSEATCTEPQTCTRCGKTDGDPLGHDWTEANYQQPAVCKVCGQEGETLTSYYDEMGLDAYCRYDAIAEGNEYFMYSYIGDYISCTKEDGKEIVCHAAITEWKKEVVYADDYDRLALEEKDGYVWRFFRVDVSFDLDDMEQYDYDVGATVYFSDLYSGAVDSDNMLTINYNGEQIDCAMQLITFYTIESDELMGTQVEYAIQLPEDYDGLCIVFTYLDAGESTSYADINTLVNTLDLGDAQIENKIGISTGHHYMGDVMDENSLCWPLG
jgi:hypothetical protein